MRTKITIIFDTHNSGTVEQLNEWNNNLLERIANALEIPDATDDYTYPLVTFDIVSIEKLAEEAEL
jgi:hypothetical protein